MAELDPFQEACPKDVWYGGLLESKEIPKQLNAHAQPQACLADDEAIVYFHRIKTSLLRGKVDVEFCIFTTNRRVVLLDKATMLASAPLDSVTSIMHYKKVSKWHYLVLMLDTGGQTELEIQGITSEVASFFANHLAQEINKRIVALHPVPEVIKRVEMMMVPKEMVFGKELRDNGIKLLTPVAQLQLATIEQLQYLYPTSSGDDVSDCIILTNRRILYVEEFQIVVRVDRLQMAGASYSFHNGFRLNLLLMSGEVQHVPVPAEVVAVFFAVILFRNVKARFRGAKKPPTEALASQKRIHSPLELRQCILQSHVAKKRRIGFVTYKNSIKGNRLVDWLVAKKFAATREDAVQLGQALAQVGLTHITDKNKTFQDRKDRIYIFQGGHDEEQEQQEADEEEDDEEDDAYDQAQGEMPLDMLKALIQRCGLIKKHRVGMRSYDDCISGADLVGFLVQNKHAPDRGAATRLAKRFFSVGLRPHANGTDTTAAGHIVVDSSKSLYRFEAVFDSRWLQGPTTDESEAEAKRAAKRDKARTARARNFDDNNAFYIVSAFGDKGLVLETRPVQCTGAMASDFELVLSHKTGAASQKWKVVNGNIVSSLQQEGVLDGLPLWFFGQKWTQQDEGFITCQLKDTEQTVYLTVKGVCCGHPHCERSRIQPGVLVGLQPLANPQRPNPLSRWKTATDFEVFMDDLLFPLLDKLANKHDGGDEEDGDSESRKSLSGSTSAMSTSDLSRNATSASASDRGTGFYSPVPDGIGEEEDIEYVEPEAFEWTGDYSCVWMGRVNRAQTMSIWKPDVPEDHVIFGFYIHIGIVELDPEGAPIVPSECVVIVAKNHQSFRRPTSYALQWFDAQGGVYLWLPISHHRSYVALGVVATTQSSPPPFSITRCVSAKLLEPLNKSQCLTQYCIMASYPAAVEAGGAAGSKGKKTKRKGSKMRKGSQQAGSNYGNLMAQRNSRRGPIADEGGYIMADTGEPVIALIGSVALGVLNVAAMYSTASKKLTVDVIEARCLLPVEAGSSNPYVKLRVLPDPNTKHKHKSAPLTRTIHPVFNIHKTFSLSAAELATSVIEILVCHHQPKGKNSLLGKVRLELTGVPVDPAPHKLGSAKPGQWHALQPDESVSADDKGMSLWRLSPMGTSLIGKHHSQPKGGAYRFPMSAQELRDDEQQLQRTSISLILEASQQLAAMMEKRLKRQSLREKNDNGISLEELQFIICSFDQTHSIVEFLHEFFDYDAENYNRQCEEQPDAPPAPEFRKHVDTLRGKVDQIFHSVKSYVYGEVSYAFDHFDNLGQGVRVLLLAWPIIAVLHPPSAPSTIDDEGDQELKTLTEDIVLGFVRKGIRERFELVYGVHHDQRPAHRTKADTRVSAPSAPRRATTPLTATSIDLGIDGLEAVHEEAEPLVVEETVEAAKIDVFKQMEQVMTDLGYVLKAGSKARLQNTRVLSFFADQYHRRVKTFLHVDLNAGKCIKIIDCIQKYQDLLREFPLDDDDWRKKRTSLDLAVNHFMDNYDSQSKARIIGWVTNTATLEKDITPEQDADGFYFTTGPQDLFTNINMAFDVAAKGHKLKGQALARVALMYAYVITYYQDLMLQHLRDEPALHCPVVKTDYKVPQNLDPDTWVQEIKDNATIKRLLAQINNSEVYENMTEDLRDFCLKSVDDEDGQHEEVLETLFDEASEGFLTLASKATSMLAGWIAGYFGPILSRLFLAEWFLKDGKQVRDDIMHDIGEVFETVARGIKRDVFVAQMAKSVARALVAQYVDCFVSRGKDLRRQRRQMNDVMKKLHLDRDAFYLYFAQFLDDFSLKALNHDLNAVEIIPILATTPPEYLGLYVEVVSASFKENPYMRAQGMTPPALVKGILNAREDDLDEDIVRKAISLYASEGTRSAAGTHHLQITVVGARNLTNKDGRVYNPYCRFRLIDQAPDGSVVTLCKRKTEAVTRTHNPSWQTSFDDFDAATARSFKAITFELCNQPAQTARRLFDGTVAEATLTLEEIQKGQLLDMARGDGSAPGESKRSGYQVELPLLSPQTSKRSRKKKTKVTGSLLLKIRYYIATTNELEAQQELRGPKESSGAQAVVEAAVGSLENFVHRKMTAFRAPSPLDKGKGHPKAPKGSLRPSARDNASGKVKPAAKLRNLFAARGAMSTNKLFKSK